jgi:hypothetical protein
MVRNNKERYDICMYYKIYNRKGGMFLLTDSGPFSILKSGASRTTSSSFHTQYETFAHELTNLLFLEN